MTPRSLVRRHPAHAVLEGRLYIIGGSASGEQYTVLNSVECFDPSTNEWQPVAPTTRARFGGSACAGNGHIYLLGGAPGTVLPMERYDPAVNSWTRVIIKIYNRCFVI